jgi:hypothetical protein
MLCFIHKWKISRAIDSERTPGGWTRRHLEKCVSCREFSRLIQDLEKRLAADATALLASADPSLAGRIKSAVAAGGAAKSFSLSPIRPKAYRLRPVWAAAASLAIVVGVSLIWTVTHRPVGMPALNSFLKLDDSRAYLETALAKAESPYHEEIMELKQTLESTADYLLSRLDVNLGPEN